MLQVYSITNKPVDSNCYVLYNLSVTKECIIIDPGSEDISEIDSFIEDNHLSPDLIFITHEHFDHIWGVDCLRNKYRCKLLASSDCSLLIQDKKKNLSLFRDGVGFEISRADVIVDSDIIFTWNDYEVAIYLSKGHSKGGIVILFDNFLFTGDTYIPGLETVVKLPGGNIKELKESMLIINKLINERKPVIYPGHNYNNI